MAFIDLQPTSITDCKLKIIVFCVLLPVCLFVYFMPESCELFFSSLKLYNLLIAR